MNPRFLGPLALGVIAVAGCRGSEHATRPATGAATTPAPPGGAGDTSAMSHMPAMGSMPDTLAANLQTGLPRLQRQGRRVESAAPGARGAPGGHAGGLQTMMAGRKMTPPRKWTTLDASLRKDLQRFATLPTAQLEASMPGHVERVKQLLTMREDMMKEMEGA